jgi:hypothetical protein
MQVKIQSVARELKPRRGDMSGKLYTGLKINDQWYDLEGDHRDLYNKVVDLYFDGKIARFASPQQPPAPAQTPPKLPPPQGGHTPHFPNRESAVEAYQYYMSRVGEFTQDAAAVVRAANCLVMMETHGEINPVHREPVSGVGSDTVPF